MLPVSEITAMTPEELEREIEKATREYVHVSTAIHLRQEKNTAKKRTQRRYLARLKTIRASKLQAIHHSAA